MHKFLKKVLGPWSIVLGLFLSACAADWDPVYFSSASPSTTAEPPAGSGSDVPVSARCSLQLTAKLCVKIKGDKLEAGLKPDDPLCADTPPIPMEIAGEKITLKGSEFPDVQVEIDIKGVKTPLTINGKGIGDGSKNIGQGTWTPEGDILIKNFSFFVNVLGVSGEITGLNLTTDEAKEVENLPAVKGSPAGADGAITLVTATKLGHLFEAADKYLLGASLQSVFEGKIDPPLSDCAMKDAGTKQIRIVKTRLDPAGIVTEEPLPEGNILAVSKGAYIARSAEDVGPSFEETQRFKATYLGSKAVSVAIPGRIGPFYFKVEGKSKRSLKSQQSIRFQVTFRPTLNETLKPGTVSEKFRFGSDLFYLRGVALKAGAKPTLNRVDDKGETTAANVDSVILNTVSAPAASIKDYFRCAKITCEEREAVTECKKCGIPNITGCQLLPVNTSGTPLEEVNAECKPKSAENLPAVSLEFSGNAASIIPSKQMIVIQNRG
ncbi:MAG: hypothetical protein U1D33_02155, partial [bacterium]|nr:hypothetical protein [bacterium]